ncbi:UDP-N-acetylglucosamine diphosphorylase/glucosamine-1-phosphate N-acetyltransferase [uncultured Roseburia sp.]|nr:UDP-N-acetylglucosamine diphosphorylase/glucosamine-1-phosphate N-acetyltransferase [uncultured Roseburia sp.]
MGVTLVIMAAGIGSRFGGGIKQLTPVGPNGEIIIDYSIYDALEAGFDKIVFIIRKDLKKDFCDIIGKRIEKICKVEYVFQELDDLPKGFEKPVDRSKPWGTGQAVLCCKDIVHEPFAVINADDYYGKEAFKKVYQYLIKNSNSKRKYCMSGFILDNTLSENGTVTRGICKVDQEDMLIKINETSGIRRDDNGIIKDGDGNVIQSGTHVSMNMWGVTPEFIDILEQGFKDFLGSVGENDLKAEYLLPTVIGDLLGKGEISVKVLETRDKWFGVTYQEDKQTVINAFRGLVENETYKSPLY